MSDSKEQKQDEKQGKEPILTKPITEESLRELYTFYATKAFDNVILPVLMKLKLELTKVTTLRRMIHIPSSPTLLEQSIIDQVDIQVSTIQTKLADMKSIYSLGWRNLKNDIAKHIRECYDYEYNSIVSFQDQVSIMNHMNDDDIPLQPSKYYLCVPECIRELYAKSNKIDRFPSWFNKRYYIYMVGFNHLYIGKIKAELWSSTTLKHYYNQNNQVYQCSILLIDDQVRILNQMVSDEVLSTSSIDFIVPVSLIHNGPRYVKHLYDTSGKSHLYPRWFSSLYPI